MRVHVSARLPRVTLSVLRYWLHGLPAVLRRLHLHACQLQWTGSVGRVGSATVQVQLFLRLGGRSVRNVRQGFHGIKLRPVRRWIHWNAMRNLRDGLHRLRDELHKVRRGVCSAVVFDMLGRLRLAASLPRVVHRSGDELQRPRCRFRCVPKLSLQLRAAIQRFALRKLRHWVYAVSWRVCSG